MALDAAVGVLACPHCTAPLAIAGRVLTCPTGHSFDVAKQGYVNLLGSAQPANADTSDMVAARDRFLSSGLYDPVAAALVDAVRDSRASTIAEVGAGTAWYLAQVLDRLPTARGVALDVSVPAARKAARAHPRAASVVADTWRRAPLVDHSVNLLLCVFAPRNLPEFQRVLAPTGQLVIIHPNPGHLAGLRGSYGLLDVDADKESRLAHQLEGFEVSRQRVSYEVEATADQVTDLVAMGPNAFHASPQPYPAASLDVDVTIVTAAVA